MVVVCSGLPGTGKSRLAEGLGSGIGISVFSVAWVLGALAPFGFLERSDRGEIAYALLTALVEHQLRLGQSAIVDGMMGSRHVRRRLRELADLNGADFRAIECVCSNATVHRERIEARNDPIPGWPDPGWDHVLDVRRRYAPWTGDRLIVDSIRPYDENLVTAKRFVLSRMGERRRSHRRLAAAAARTPERLARLHSMTSATGAPIEELGRLEESRGPSGKPVD